MEIILRPVAAIPYPIVARALLVGYGLNAIAGATGASCFALNSSRRPMAATGLGADFDRHRAAVRRNYGYRLSRYWPAVRRRGKPNAGLLIKVLVTGSVLFGVLLVAAIYLSGSVMSRIVGRFPGFSGPMAMVQQVSQILRTWRTLEVIGITLLIYVPDAFTLWFLVKAVGLTLGFSDTLVLLGAASLSTLVPSGPAFLGTCNLPMRWRSNCRPRSRSRHRCGNSRAALPASPSRGNRGRGLSYTALEPLFTPYSPRRPFR